MVTKDSGSPYGGGIDECHRKKFGIETVRETKTFVNSLTLIRLDLQAKQPGEGFPVLTMVTLPRRVSLRKEKSSTCSYPGPFLALSPA